MTEAETLGVDRWLAASHPELVAAPPGRDGGGAEPHEDDASAVPPTTVAGIAPLAVEHGRGRLLLPQAAGTDGMFVLRLRR